MEKDLLQLITAALGSLGFSLIFNVRGRPLLFGALGGLIAWGVYLGCRGQGISDVMG